MIYADSKVEIEAKRRAFIRKWRMKCRAVADSLEEAGDKLFTFTRSRKVSGNRSAHRMQLNVCTESSSGGSRPRLCCPQQKPRPCCSGLCWLLARSLCAKLRAGGASTKGQPIKRLTSPHDRITSSCWRSCRNQFQHKSRRHPSTKGQPIKRLTSPHDRIASSCWRSCQNQFQHKSRRHRRLHQNRQESLPRRWAPRPRSRPPPERPSANRSLSIIVPVSALPVWKLENGQQRPAPEARPARTERSEIVDQRLGRPKPNSRECRRVLPCCVV